MEDIVQVIENDDDIVEIPVEDDAAEKLRKKRIEMCNAILEIEQNNINKTNKDSDAEMARKIVGIIERFA